MILNFKSHFEFLDWLLPTKVLTRSSDTPKKEGPTKTWNEDSLNNALEALRTGTISANKASKAFGIPSSTLYKIARREGIRLAAPFNAAPTTWSAEDLEKALEGEIYKQRV